MMGVLRKIAPIGSIAILTFIAALPWGLPAGERFALPLLPVVAIHYWTLRHDAWIPEWCVFLAGLTLDVLTQGPLGYWALIYLAAHLVATTSARFAGPGPWFRLLLLAGALLVVTFIAWLVSSMYFMELADPRPYIVGAVLAGVAALGLLPLLKMLDTPDRLRDNARLKRGV